MKNHPPLTVVLFDNNFCTILKKKGVYLRIDKILDTTMELEAYFSNCGELTRIK